MLKVEAVAESWPIDGAFVISSAVITEIEMAVVRVERGGIAGRGEGVVPETDPAGGAAAVRAIDAAVARLGPYLTREDLQQVMPAGPARNAIDCALWDLECKEQGRRAWDIAGIEVKSAIPTAYTLGIDTPVVLAVTATRTTAWPLIKLKLGGGDGLDVARVEAVREARPDCRIIIDANCAWTIDELAALAPELARLGVELIEQPLPAGADQALSGYKSPVPLCADESCQDRSSLPDVVGKYDFINIKLDKTGGLTEALALAHEARAAGLGLMVGSMVGTSLSMAPAMLIAQLCEFADLDGPLLLARDRAPAIGYENGAILLPSAELWG